MKSSASLRSCCPPLRGTSPTRATLLRTIDHDLGGDAARQVMTLLLASSLSRAVGGRIGLSESEQIEFLVAPQRKPDEYQQALQHLREAAWYLHREDQRFFVKETENLARLIERNAKEVPQPKIDQALITRLTGILEPDRKVAYQDVQVLPRLDELKLSGPRTLIVIKPDGRVPPSELQRFFEYQQEKQPSGAHRPGRWPTRLRAGFASCTQSSRMFQAATTWRYALRGGPRQAGGS